MVRFTNSLHGQNYDATQKTDGARFLRTSKGSPTKPSNR